MSTAAPKELTGRHVLAIAVAFFTVIISVNLAMAMFATSSWTGLLAKNGYVASIDYAKDEKERAKAAALGWTVRIASDEGRVVVTLADRAGEMLTPSSVSGTVQPLLSDDVEELTFTARNGAYRSDVALSTGEWIVKIALSLGGDVVVSRAKLTVRPLP